MVQWRVVAQFTYKLSYSENFSTVPSLAFHAEEGRGPISSWADSCVSMVSQRQSTPIENFNVETFLELHIKKKTNRVHMNFISIKFSTNSSLYFPDLLILINALDVTPGLYYVN